MAYRKRPEIVTKQTGEHVVEIDAGDLVAVSCTHLRCEITQCPVFEASARWVDEGGLTRLDKHGAAVVVKHRHTASHEEIARHGLDRLIRACLYLVLGEAIENHAVDGEDTPVLGFSSEVLATANIRNAVASAKRTFQTVDAANIL